MPKTHKPGIYETYWGNTVQWDGSVAYDLDMREEIPVELVRWDRFLRDLD